MDYSLVPLDPFWVAVGILVDRFEVAPNDAIDMLCTAAEYSGVTVDAEARAVIGELDPNF